MEKVWSTAHIESNTNYIGIWKAHTICIKFIAVALSGGERVHYTTGSALCFNKTVNKHVAWTWEQLTRARERFCLCAIPYSFTRFCFGLYLDGIFWLKLSLAFPATS